MTRAVGGDRILKDVNGNINDHLRNHIHLTNCIHLKNHMHSKHSPISADRALMRELVSIQRSRSLRDPSPSPHSRLSFSGVDALLKRAGMDEFVPGRTSGAGAVSRSSGGGRKDRHINSLSKQVKDAPDESENQAQMETIRSRSSNLNNNNNRGKRRKFRAARRARPSEVANQDAEAQNDMSVASNQNVNGCGASWNWSRIHDRGKSFLDLAGRSISCSLSDSRMRKGGPNIPDMPENSSSSSTKSEDREASLPLLQDGSGSGRTDAWLHDYSGELGIFADSLLNNGTTDSDLLSEGRSRHLLKYQKNGRHQNFTQKYMPRTFRDLVGQNLVVRALSNAIEKQKVGLVYLFYGPHGTGKTSCAHVFARALNCQSLEDSKPCGLCNSCVKARNVKEISPVSNIDFESIVELLNSAITSRAKSQYRVLIFDECDTLSSECWSAILKAVDRAPRRFIFVLVCSALDALPHVILSRCQKFYFPKLKDADIIYTLQWIATKEDLEIDKDALKLIASRSEGSLRDAEMTLEQLSLLGKRISLGLVQELTGLISDEKLVDLLDLALSGDTVNTVKNLRDIMESGVEPLALMSQLATVITDILAGSYDFTREGSRRKFFRQQALSKEDMEKLRRALKTLSEAEKQLRVSSDRMTWLTAALLQLAPDQQYMLPNSSARSSFHHSPLVSNNNDSLLRERPRKSNAENMPSSRAGNNSGNGAYQNAKSKGATGLDDKNRINSEGVYREEIDEVWLRVIENIPFNSVKELMYREGKLVSVNYGEAWTVQLLFSSHPSKSKAEKFRLHILQAFESVLRSPVTIEIRCEPGKDAGAGPILLPAATHYPCRPDVGPTTHTISIDDSDIRRLQNRDASSSGIKQGEIVEIEASPEEIRNSRSNAKKIGEGISTQKISSLLGERSQSLSIVRRKVSLANVIQHAEGNLIQQGGWSKRKAISIAEKLEQENLKLEPRSRRLLCWNTPKVTRRKSPRLKIRSRRPRSLLKYVSCGRCLSGRSPRIR